MFAASYSWNSCLKMLCICSKLFDHLTYFICLHNTANGLFGQSKSRANPKLGFHLGTHLWPQKPFQGFSSCWSQWLLSRHHHLRPRPSRWSPSKFSTGKTGVVTNLLEWYDFSHIWKQHISKLFCNWYYLMLTSWMYNNLPPSIHKCHSM